MPARRHVLQGLASVPFLPVLGLGPASARAAGGTLSYGWDPEVEGPVDADVYVAPGGDDDGPGSRDRPLARLAAGVARLAARGSGTLAIRGGLYREAVSLDALRGRPEAPFRLHRYGRERVTVTAAEVLTGWTACTPDAAAALGVPAAGLYVALLPRAALAHGDPLALNLHEAGNWCPLATDRADPSVPEAVADHRRFHRAEPILDDEDRIVGFRDPRLAGQSPGALAGAELLIYHHPVLVSPGAIAAFDPDRGIVRLADATRRVQRTGRDRAPDFRYALRNVAAGLRDACWLVRPAPDDHLAVYFRPRDPGNLAGRIEVSLRDHCLDLGRARHVDLLGLEFVRSAGTAQGAGAALRSIGKGAEADRGLSIRHCRAAETLTTNARGFGGVYLRGVDGVRIERLSIADIRGGFGLFLSDCREADIRGLHVVRTSQSPGRFFGLRDSVLAFSLFEDSASDAHANAFNFYDGSDAVLVYGVRTRNAGGYVTYQEASRICFAFCRFEATTRENDTRALVSQNLKPGAGQGGADGSGDPVTGGTFRYWNLTLPPDPAQPDKANALSLGPAGSSQRHALHNCIIHGGGFGDIYVKGANPSAETRSHNLYTGLAYWQSPRYGWKPGPGEAVAGPGQRTIRGRDMRAEIAAGVAPLFPGFTDWDLDVDGRRVDWDNPPVGAEAG